MTIPATSAKSFRPSALPFTASRRRVVREVKLHPAKRSYEDSVLLESQLATSLEGNVTKRTLPMTSSGRDVSN